MGYVRLGGVGFWAINILVMEIKTQTCVYRDRLKCLYVVARNFFLLLLTCFAWPCLALPGPAWLLLNKICKPFSRSLYIKLEEGK